MKALIPTGNPNDMVRFADVAEPVPGAADVVVAVEAFSINRGETFLLEKPSDGWRPGKDVVGRVVAAAADGSGPPLGTRVVAHPRAGGWAERVAVGVDRLAALPDSLSSEHAAALPLAGLTALRLVRAAGPRAGRRVLITGAAGGVGHFFVELAGSVGAAVTAVVASRHRGRRLLELGADRVITDVEDAEFGMHVVLESVGGATTSAALARLAPRGQLIWFGQASRTPATIDFFSFFARSRSATIRHFDYTDTDVSDGEDLATLVRLTTNGRLHPEIGARDPWSETSARIADLRQRRILGKAILTIQ
jgi:NADPH:quinone reductase-like Zn-dependent oxidoreductase